MSDRPDEQPPNPNRSLYWAAIVAIMLGLTALYSATLRNDGGMRLQQDGKGARHGKLTRRTIHATGETTGSGHF
jgi:hypothetical protein